MALSAPNADAVAQAICTALGVADAPSVAKWKTVMEKIYAGLKTDIVITLPASSVVTTGGPATQTGPTAPVVMTPA